ncbi:penicillin-binding transpeptidase domain-containing protein [Nonomuraea sp. NPDC050680]|uniref:penicillin-binding transpeptidase domain-containing protein n=1 Tax=Nonomuraea sp. NPDC050680 TaxID=3154630 RepID=UPI0033E03063
MAGPRAKRINIPLRRVAKGCAMLLFAVLANITVIQGFGGRGLNADPRNQRSAIARFDHPRGDILTYDGTTVATSRATAHGPYAYRRAYPEGERYAPVTGTASLSRTTGIEGAADDVLSGDDPRIEVRSLVRHGKARGADVRLTIIDRAQAAAYEGLKAAGRPGAAVALNPATGAILALASYPSYDPNAYTTTNPTELAKTDRRLRGDPTGPLLNRAVSLRYPPGSAFKLVTAAAALSSGEYSPTSRVNAPARLRLPGSTAYLPDTGGHCGDTHPTLPDAFRSSCDTAFAGIGLQLGQDILRDQAEAFGFNDRGLTIPLQVIASTYPPNMDRAQTALSAIGRHDVRVTPLMIAMLSAAVANHGVLMRPYLVEDVRLPDGSLIDRADPAPYRVTMPAALAGQLTSMMLTVTGAGGSGTAAAIPGVEVAAKSGAGEDHALFTAFAPADTPEVAVGVVLEHAAPSTAALIARAVLEAALS